MSRRAVRDVDVYIEQPCASYEECLSVRRHTDRPLVLDESIDGIDALLRGHSDVRLPTADCRLPTAGVLSCHAIPDPTMTTNCFCINLA